MSHSPGYGVGSKCRTQRFCQVVTLLPLGACVSQTHLAFTLQTSFIPEKEEYNKTRQELFAEMDVCMGGRVAEELIYGFNKVTTGG